MEAAEEIETLSQPIHFLKMSKVSEYMLQAFNSLNHVALLHPLWIHLAEVPQLINDMPGSVLVIDSIDSREARKVRTMCRKNLKSLGENNDKSKYIPLKVFTAYAFISLNPINVKHLPSSRYPISSICMKDCHVTVAGLGPLKSKEITRKLLSMCASFRRSLHRRTEFVIADNWTTAKIAFLRRCYPDANSSCVVKPEWVERCWEMREDIKDATELVGQFKLPIFTGMHFCVSGFDTHERTKICRLVNENGGTYSQGLHLPSYKFDGGVTQTRSQLAPYTGRLTTHLIVSDKKGPKYEAAMNLNREDHIVHIVNYDWFRVSTTSSFPQSEIDPKFCARDSEAMLELKKAELERKQKAVLDYSQGFIENMQQNIPDSQEIPKTTKSIDPISELQNLLSSTVIIENKNIDNLNIFNDLRFFICGLSSVHQSSAKKLISRFGGLTYADLVSAVSHILIGPQITNKEILNIRRHDERVGPVVKVNLEWIVRCIKENVLLPEFVDPSTEKLLNSIQSTQDLNQEERMEIYRERAEPKATDMDNKLRELATESTSTNRNNNKKRKLKLGAGNVPYSPIRITKLTSHQDSISCSIPIQYQYQDEH